MMKKQNFRLIMLMAYSLIINGVYGQPTLYYQASPSPANTYGIASSNKMGDVDNDGDMDLIISGYSADNSSSATILYKYDGPNQFEHDTTLANLHDGSVHFADIDNDNDLDILITGEDDSFVRHTKLFFNDGTGYFTEDLTHGITGVSYSDADFGDIDGDGDLDLIITGESPSFITELYLNDGNGNFTLVTGTSFSPGRSGEIKFFDSDGDGDLDFLVTGSDSGPGSENTDLYINDGNGNFTVDNTLAILDFRSSSFDVGDVDGDGDLDVIINGRHNFVNESILYLNDGSGNFTQSAGPTFLGGTSSDVQFGDIDGDNDLDFVVMGWGNSNITFLETYLNDGNGNFTLHAPSEFIPSGARSGEISIADANGNGKNDVFLTGLREIGIYVTHYYMNYTPPCTSSSSITLTECDSYEVPSGDETYTTNGIYKDTIPNFNGCDSVITIDLTIVNSSTSNQSVTTCGSYDWNGTIYNSTGTYNQTIPNHLGCDSVMTLNLVVNQEATGLDVQSACDDFTWIDGNTYTQSNNTATHTITGGAANGCDSTVTLDLTINESYSTTDDINACDSHTWIDGNTYTTDNNTATQLLSSVDGCDSLVTLNLTINNSTSGTDTQIACNEFLWIDGNTYTADNNSATFVLTNNEGCDSTVTLDLTITSVDPSVTVSNETITSNYSGGTYQWIDCNDNNSPISGAVNQSFTAQSTGSYAVIITDNNCSVTSDCEDIDFASIEALKKDEIVVYPNPNNGQFFIEVNIVSQLEIIDVTGRIVNSTRLEKGKNKIQMNGESNGLYLLKIKKNGQTITQRITINY